MSFLLFLDTSRKSESSTLVETENTVKYMIFIYNFFFIKKKHIFTHQLKKCLLLSHHLYGQKNLQTNAPQNVFMRVSVGIFTLFLLNQFQQILFKLNASVSE